MGKLKVVCPHTDAEREQAMFDLACCPICLREENKRLQARNEDLVENLRLANAENKSRPGRPPLLNTVAKWRDHLQAHGTLMSKERGYSEYVIDGKILHVHDDGTNGPDTMFIVIDADGNAIYPA